MEDNYTPIHVRIPVPKEEIFGRDPILEDGYEINGIQFRTFGIYINSYKESLLDPKLKTAYEKLRNKIISDENFLQKKIDNLDRDELKESHVNLK